MTWMTTIEIWMVGNRMLKKASTPAITAPRQMAITHIRNVITGMYSSSSIKIALTSSWVNLNPSLVSRDVVDSVVSKTLSLLGSPISELVFSEWWRYSEEEFFSAIVSSGGGIAEIWRRKREIASDK